MSDRDRLKAALADLRRRGFPARHAWVGDGFDGVQVDYAGAPISDLYTSDGTIYDAVPLACPLALSLEVVRALLAHGLEAVSCPFFDLGVVYAINAGNTAEAEYRRARWEAEIADWPWAALGLSVEECYRRGLVSA